MNDKEVKRMIQGWRDAGGGMKEIDILATGVANEATSIFHFCATGAIEETRHEYRGDASAQAALNSLAIRIDKLHKETL